MNNSRFRSALGESGQTFLLAVLLFIVLITSIPVIIYVNQSSGKHQVMEQQKTKGRSVADEGVAYAVQQLSIATSLDPVASSVGSVGGGAAGGNDATVVLQSPLPRVMFLNQLVPVLIRMRNTGTAAWLGGSAYKLSPLNPANNDFWNHADTRPDRHVLLDAGDNITQGSVKIFNFIVQAPAVAGTYQYQWGMNEDGGTGPFGTYTANVTVSVAALPAPPAFWPPWGGTLPTATGALFSAQGESYDLQYYSTSPTGLPTLEPYQVGILSRPLDKLGNPLSGSSIYSIVSPKTVSVKLTTALSAAAAVQLQRVPAIGVGANLKPQWGPIAVFDTASLNVDTWMDTTRSPRKFSLGPITGTTYERADDDDDLSSDQKEYWAYADLGKSSPIDLAFYQSQAQSTNIGFTGMPASWSCLGTCAGFFHHSNSGYFYVPAGATLVIDGTSTTDWAYTSSSGVLFIDGGQNGLTGGNVEFRNVAIDLKDEGAIIVTGNMSIGRRRDASGLAITSAPVPPTAALDSPFNTTFLCSGYVNTVGHMCPDVSSTWGAGAARPSLRGFIYAMKDMGVLNHTPGPGNDTTIVGTLRVDGQLALLDNVNLNVFLDAPINRSIRTTFFELQTDTTIAVP